MSWKRLNKANLRGNALYKNLLSIQQELIMHRGYVMYKFIFFDYELYLHKYFLNKTIPIQNLFYNFINSNIFEFQYTSLHRKSIEIIIIKNSFNTLFSILLFCIATILLVSKTYLKLLSILCVYNIRHITTWYTHIHTN